MTTSDAETTPINWELDSLYPPPGSREFSTLVDAYGSSLDRLTEEVGQLPRPSTESAKAWGEALESLSKIRTDGSSLRSYIGCHAAADAENQTIQQLEARMASLGPSVTALELQFEVAFGQLSEAESDGLTAADDRLAENRFYLEEAAEAAKFRLPGDLERLYSELSVDGLNGWSRLYDRLSGSLRVQVMERGVLVEKSPGQVETDMPDRARRVENFYAAHKAWSGIADVCADALNHIAGARLTKYDRLGVDHLEYPLRLNRMTRATFETMNAVIDGRADRLADFLDEKARWVGVDKLAWYDVLAPLPLRAEGATLTWQQAADTVVETLGEFSPAFGKFSSDALRDRWIEAEDRSGKRQGGFCTDLPAQRQSRIFMTFTGSANSMSTLAHELGHAYHTYLLRDEPPLLRDYPMNLAETASTFAEAVVGERRLADADDDSQRLDVLDNQCCDAVAFLMNLRCRVLFEDAFHVRRREGELTADELSGLMTDAQTTAFRAMLNPTELNPLFWCSKLHFYIDDWPFYNFPYTFGYLLSLGLFAEGRQSPEEFPDRFDRFLKLTGRMSSEDAVREGFGYDLTERTFWDLALDEIDRRVAAFLELSPTLR